MQQLCWGEKLVMPVQVSMWLNYYDKLSLDPETDAFDYLDAFEKQNANKIREIVTGNPVEDE